MTRQVPMDRRLSEEDRAYLYARGLDARVAQLDEAFPEQPEDDGTETMPNYTTSEWTLAKLQAEVDRVNTEYDVEPPLSKEGTKAEIVARLTEWWGKE